MWSSDSESSDDVDIYVRRPRVYKPRKDYTCIENTYEFNKRFRLSAENLEQLINLLGPSLQRQSNRSESLSVKLQLQLALHWFGTGAQHHAVGDMHGVSKASVCRSVQDVVGAVNTVMFADYVKWPANCDNIVRQFFQIGGMPMVCGCIDGTLVNIDAPSVHEATFVDRHGNHSVNCMVVCGPDLAFYYSYANWPGSTHDSRVLRNSGLFARSEEGWRPVANGVILGDSAYPLKDWLIPPLVRDAENRANIRFLRAHKITRRLVENAIGILKEKFPCLNHLRVKPEFACQIFNCCVTLCNFSRNPDGRVVLDNVPDCDDTVQLEEQQDLRGIDRLQRILNYFRG